MKKYLGLAIILTFISFNIGFASDKPTNGSVGNGSSTNGQSIDGNNTFTEEDLKNNNFANNEGTLFYDKHGNPILNLDDLMKYDIVYDEYGNPIYVKELTEEDLKLYTYEGKDDNIFLDENGKKVSDKTSSNNSSNKEQKVNSNLTLYIMMLGIGSGAYFFNAKNL